MSKFTKGKWIIDDSDIYGEDKYIHAGNLNNTPIAKVIKVASMEQKEVDVNARLIAAAPEMYAWLRKIYEAPYAFEHDEDDQLLLCEFLEDIDGE